MKRETIANKDYRRVVATTSQIQLVLMNIPTGEEIGAESHPSTTQFFRVESGRGVAIVSGKRYNLRSGDALIVPAGKRHNIISTDNLVLYTIYSPPEHPMNRVQRVKKD